MRMDDDDVPAVTGTQAITRAQLYGVKPLAQILQAGGGLFRVIGAAAAPSADSQCAIRLHGSSLSVEGNYTLNPY
jgi:hypothetical protein